MLKRILRGAGVDALKYFPVRLVPALTALVTVRVFTTLIGPKDYGDFYLVTAATSLATSLATTWIASSIVRFYWIAHREKRIDDYTSTVLWLTLGSLLTVATALGLGLWGASAFGLLTPSLARLVPVAIVALVVNASFTTLLQVMRAANRATAFATLSVSSNLVGTAAAVYLVAVPHLGSMGIIAGIALGNALAAPFLVRQLAAEGSVSPHSFSRPFLTDFLHYGIPLVPAAVSSWVLVLADRYVIGGFKGATAVGLYAVAYGLGDKLMQLITMPLIATMTPVLMETYEKQGQDMAQAVQSQFTRYFLMACAPLLAGLAVAGQDFMRVFSGPSYWASYPILAIVAAGSMSSNLAQLAGSGLGLHRRSAIIMQNTLLAAGFNIASNLLLVPRFGYMAAAYDTLASYLLLFLLTMIRSRRYMAWIIPWGAIAKIAGAAVIAAAAVWALFPGASRSPVVLVSEAVIGIAVYVAGLLLLRALDAEERAFFAQAARAGLGRLVPGRRRRRDGDDTDGRS